MPSETDLNLRPETQTNQLDNIANADSTAVNNVYTNAVISSDQTPAHVQNQPNSSLADVKSNTINSNNAAAPNTINSNNTEVKSSNLSSNTSNTDNSNNVSVANIRENSANSKPADLQISLSQINLIVESITNLLDGRKLDPGMLIRIIANCMKVAAKMRVSNSLKKKIVIAGIEKFIQEKSGLPAEDVSMIMGLAEVLLSDAIDTLADVAGGKISFKKLCCSCFS